MPYTVVWLRAAEDALTRIWLHATNKQAVTRAANRIDPTLKRNPERQGDPEDGTRLLRVGPLVVRFEVLPEDCLVRVLGVAYRP
jgi:hypothetical protein